ncbi:MAG: DEAD/DEAH box helicase [Burkholderiales bacterium]|nr:DEAD/DEAH box helicase [Burkholderiales bacterium]
MKILSFADLGLCSELVKAVSEIGYTTPTPIQTQAIPVVLKGGDVMGSAQTGTGKTAGFALPILQKLMTHANSSPSPARHPVRALILAPTRELAIQNETSIKAYAKYTKLRSTVVFGGVNIKQQTPTLLSGVEVLVATPGRLLDHIEQKTVALNQVEFFVLDEADRMLDMGFIPDIRKILKLLPQKRQSLLFSATFSNEIKKLAGDMLHQPVVVEVARQNTAAETVQQNVCFCETGKKRAALEAIIAERNLWQALCFVRTRQMASQLCRTLKKSGIVADAIHGDKTQAARIETLANFKSGKTQILVATDVAARGLDIEELPIVINYDIPTSPEDYVHRIGRTGRAGAKGIAITLVTPADEEHLTAIEKLIRQKIPRLTLDIPEGASADKPARREKSERVSKEEPRRSKETEDRDRAARYAKNPDQPLPKKKKESAAEPFLISSVYARLLDMRRTQTKTSPVPALLIRKKVTAENAPDKPEEVLLPQLEAEFSEEKKRAKALKKTPKKTARHAAKHQPTRKKAEKP